MLIDAFTMKTLVGLRRFARIVFVVGVAASLGANYLHAPVKATAVATGIAAAIAMFPSLALLLTTELVIRVPLRGAPTTLVVFRVLGTVLVAGIAGWVSYRHMQAVSAEYGEGPGLNANLFPLAVDGLMVVASISLVQLNFMILMKNHKEFLAKKAEIDAAAARMAVQATDQVPTLEPVKPQQQPAEAVQRVTETATERPLNTVEQTPAERVLEVLRRHPSVTTIKDIAMLARVSEATARKHVKAARTQTSSPIDSEEAQGVSALNGNQS
jgi:hypothetical protein